jgi:hypothetical protein
MIRYSVTLKELEELIDRASPKWRAAAKKKTLSFKKAGRYSEKTGSWSEVKQVYMDLQHGKCAFCERQFGQARNSRIEHDVEHFRPKSAVKPWPPAKSKIRYSFSTGAASPAGYYLLAYNILNYAVACKRCNSVQKSDCFPIAGNKRALRSEDWKALAKEQPFLIYPVSELDDDPEDLITFEGIFPVPMAARGHAYRRARVTIDFFDLATREELLRERALLVKAIYVAFDNLEDKDQLRQRDALQTINQIDQPKLAHRNCARSFHRLCRADAVTARRYYSAAIGYLASVGYG